ncbi:MAG: cupin domain-containing protein [Anaerolineales bacterium]|nr:cupin domain-containing protein [Anaerolineales bacterium]
MNTTISNRIYSYKANEGEALWWMGSLAVIKASGKDTDERFSLVEVVEHEGAVAPLHVHHNEDEAFWILEGSLTFEVGDKTIKAEAGSFLFGPKDIPHRYTVDKGPARLLFILTPSGFEDFIRETSESAPTFSLPAAPEAPPTDEEMEQLMPLVQKYGMEILG